MIVIKSPREIELMRAAGEIVAYVLESIKNYAKPGMTTLQLDKMAEDILKRKKKQNQHLKDTMVTHQLYVLPSMNK